LIAHVKQEMDEQGKRGQADTLILANRSCIWW